MRGSDQRAADLAKRIQDKAAALLAPLELEMRLAKWSPEFRAIMLNAVAVHALKLAAEAGGGTKKDEAPHG